MLKNSMNNLHLANKGKGGGEEHINSEYEAKTQGEHRKNEQSEV